MVDSFVLLTLSTLSECRITTANLKCIADLCKLVPLTTDGDPCKLYVVRLSQLLSKMSSERPDFAAVIKNALIKSGGQVLRNDSVTPVKPLKHGNQRKADLVYRSFLDLCPWLRNSEMRFPISVLRETSSYVRGWFLHAVKINVVNQVDLHTSGSFITIGSQHHAFRVKRFHVLANEAALKQTMDARKPVESKPAFDARMC